MRFAPFTWPFLCEDHLVVDHLSLQYNGTIILYFIYLILITIHKKVHTFELLVYSQEFKSRL